MRILIVEDERALCDAIARSLRNLAYSVDCCHDGQEALDLLGVEVFDLVVLDLNLPRIDGMTVHQGTSKTDRETKVLILSARGKVFDKVTGLDAGRQRLPHQAVSSGRARGENSQPHAQALRTRQHSFNLRKAQL